MNKHLLTLALLIPALLFGAVDETAYRANEQAEAARAALFQKRAVAQAQADALIKQAFRADLDAVSIAINAKECKREVAKIRGDKEASNQQRVAAMDKNIKECETKAKEKTEESRAKRAEAERLLADADISHAPILAFTFPNECTDPNQLLDMAMRPKDNDRPIIYDETKDNKAQAAALIASAVSDERECLATHAQNRTARMNRSAKVMAGAVFTPEECKCLIDASKALSARQNYLAWQAFQKRTLAKKLLTEAATP